MKIPTTHTRAGLLTAGLLLAGASAQAVVWDGGGVDDEFSTALNWSDDAVPAGGATTDISGNFTVERSVDSTSGRTFVDDGAVLNVTGGTHNDNNSSATHRNFVGNSGDGTVNQSGGTFLIGHVLAIGRNGGAGIYNLSGGDLDVYRGGNSLAGNPNTFGGSNGNSISLGWGTTGTGLMNITGGSLVTRIGVEVGDNGTFQVLGDGASSIGIGSSGSLDGHWWQEAGGVLSMGIGATGVTSILIDDNDTATTDSYVRFEAGSILDLGFHSTATIAGTWSLMTLENGDIDDQGLTLAAGDEAAGWSFNIDNSGTDGLLTATYTPVPEPGTFALLAGCMSLMAVVLRRRRG